MLGLVEFEILRLESCVGRLGRLQRRLLEPDERVRWRAASAFGRTVARLFDEKPEDARQLVRQFMWRLNEESGNIAWGIPEAFGEILAAQPQLARDFRRFLGCTATQWARDQAGLARRLASQSYKPGPLSPL